MKIMNHLNYEPPYKTKTAITGNFTTKIAQP